MKITAEKETWFIVENDRLHNGKLEKDNWVESNSNIITFETEEEWRLELEKRGTQPMRIPSQTKMELPTH